MVKKVTLTKILITGLPGSGKTTLAKGLRKRINDQRLNADKARKKYNDRVLSKKTKKKYIIADFVSLYSEGRKIFKADYLIWMNTIKKVRLSTFDKTF